MSPLSVLAQPTGPPDLADPFYWLNFSLLGVFFLMLISGKGLMTTNRHNEVIIEKDKQIHQARADVDEWKGAWSHEQRARERESEARILAEQRADVAVEAAKTVSAALDALRTELLGRRP
jgi:hypothetical protein